ncbi:MAG: hypothetical protein ACRDQA_25785, partial [Nocardioidaceae bacterium]
MERAVIEGHDLTKRFGQAAALAGAGVAVCCGESVAVMGPSGARHQEVVLGGDIRTGVFVVLAVCYLVAIVSAGIMAVSAVLDRRRAYALLRLAGTPLAVLD